MTASNEADKDYAELRAVLDEAFIQATRGKGAKRHANGKPWTQQPVFAISEVVGTGFAAGQALKKLGEATRMIERSEFAAAREELLGAIVYAAALSHMLKERVVPFPRGYGPHAGLSGFGDIARVNTPDD